MDPLREVGPLPIPESVAEGTWWYVEAAAAAGPSSGERGWLRAEMDPLLFAGTRPALIGGSFTESPVCRRAKNPKSEGTNIMEEKSLATIALARHGQGKQSNW